MENKENLSAGQAGKENKRVSILVEEDDPKKRRKEDDNRSSAEKLKKPLIIGLLIVVFLGCMYLIFKPSADKKKMQDTGLNNAVPQATDAGMQADKQKAYEQEMLDQKEKEKRNALTTLSDYWSDSTKKGEEGQEDAEDQEGSMTAGKHSASNNAALNSYRNAQNVLGSFYKEDNSEVQSLRKQLEDLKEKLAEKEVPKPITVNDQLALMEKSYQMAAKYLPNGNNSNNSGNSTNQPSGDSLKKSNTQKEYFVAFTPAKKSAVSALYREPTDSAFLANWSETRNRGFHTATALQQAAKPKNSIRACVQQTQTISSESDVRLRLLEPAQTPNRTLPEGSLLTAMAKFQGGRLQLKISSIEQEGSIIPVDITVYDLDGQQGLFVPYSPEINALTEMAGNMSQTGGTSVMLTQSAGQQIAADLSRGVVQGISGYFSKKVRTPKVTLKAGHQVLLVSKK